MNIDVPSVGLDYRVVLLMGSIITTVSLGVEHKGHCIDRCLANSMGVLTDVLLIPWVSFQNHLIVHLLHGRNTNTTNSRTDGLCVVRSKERILLLYLVSYVLL